LLRRLETHSNQSVNHIHTYSRLSLEVLWRLSSSLQFLCKTFREEEDSVSPFSDLGEKIEMISDRITSEGLTVAHSSCLFVSSMEKATGTYASERVRDVRSRRWNPCGQTRYTVGRRCVTKCRINVSRVIELNRERLPKTK
jgi:hypothetical protein